MVLIVFLCLHVLLVNLSPFLLSSCNPPQAISWLSSFFPKDIQIFMFCSDTVMQQIKVWWQWNSFDSPVSVRVNQWCYRDSNVSIDPHLGQDALWDNEVSKDRMWGICDIFKRRTNSDFLCKLDFQGKFK